MSKDEQQQRPQRRIPGDELKAFSTPAEFKTDFPQRLVTGYVSAFNVVDQVDDVVLPTAFNKTIADRFPRNLIKAFFDHEIPIGMPRELAPDSIGLLMVYKVLDGTEYDKYLQMVVEKVCGHMSFAYDVIRRDFMEQDGKTVRMLQELRLWEGGQVIFPANEQAVLLGVKSAKELKEAIYGARGRVDPLLAKDGFLADRDLAILAEEMPLLSAAKRLEKQIKSMEARMETMRKASDSTLATDQPEPVVATTAEAEPSPTIPSGVRDPEEGAYGELLASVASLQAEVALAGIRAAAQ